MRQGTIRTTVSQRQQPRWGRLAGTGLVLMSSLGLVLNLGQAVERPSRSKTKDPPPCHCPPPRSVLPDPLARHAAAAAAEAMGRVEVSAEDQRRIGRQWRRAYLAAAARRGHRIITDARTRRYFQDLVDTLRPFLRRTRRARLRIVVLDGDTADAHAFPDGSLVFCRGLLRLADSEAALLGVVGHELAHLEEGHLRDQIRRARLPPVVFDPRAARGFSPDRFLQSGLALADQVARPFRPEEEAQADCDAATWVYLAGYDPRPFARLFERMGRIKGEPPKSGIDWFRSHPASRDRARAVRARYQQLQRWRPAHSLVIGRENLRRRISRRRQNGGEES